MKTKTSDHRIPDAKPYGPAAKRTAKKAITALVPGSYDPVTEGHMALIRHASEKYRKVYAVIFVNKDKTYRFSLEKRLEMLRAACARYENVTVDADGGMLWEYAKRKRIRVTVRGWRDEKDLAYEEEMARFNQSALPTLRTELIRSEGAYEHLSSSYVRALLDKGETPEGLVPEEAMPVLTEEETKRKNRKKKE
ncbi:MAG: pantetheine-phosphate adenylyltransferase [Clostridia bacterium]|nr:pantetheine-phosphate adenylyltransferase [Clostridia bacterium]